MLVLGQPMSLGPASFSLKLCSSAGCQRPAIARTKCRRCYNGARRQGLLHQLPKSGPFRVHFDVRLTEGDAALLVRLSRATGKTQAELLREAAIEYLKKCNIQ